MNQLPTIVAPRPSSCSGAAYSQVPVSVSARPLLPTCTAVPKSHRLCAQACASAHAGQRAEGVRQRWAQEAGSGGGGRQRVASFIEQHIVGFEVAVDEATRVQVLEYEHERRRIEAHLAGRGAQLQETTSGDAGISTMWTLSELRAGGRGG